MTITFRKNIAVFGLILTAAGITACDQTAAEHQQQLVDERLALYQHISTGGAKDPVPYVGTITTQGSTCNFSLVFLPSLSTSTATDGTSGQGTAELQGNLTVDCGSWQATEAVPNMYYFSQDNSTNGSFGGTASITLMSGITTIAMASFNLSGNLNGNEITGDFEMSNPAGLSGSFDAIQGAPNPPQSISARPGVVTEQIYHANYQAPCPSNGPTAQQCPFSLDLTTQLLATQAARIYNQFSSTQKLISVQLKNWTYQQSEPDGTTQTIHLDQVGFPFATLDVENRSLDSVQSGVGSANATVELHCAEVGVNLSCSYIGNSGGSVTEFTAVPSTN